MNTKITENQTATVTSGVGRNYYKAEIISQNSEITLYKAKSESGQDLFMVKQHDKDGIIVKDEIIGQTVGKEGPWCTTIVSALNAAKNANYYSRQYS